MELEAVRGIGALRSMRALCGRTGGKPLRRGEFASAALGSFLVPLGLALIGALAGRGQPVAELVGGLAGLGAGVWITRCVFAKCQAEVGRW